MLDHPEPLETVGQNLDEARAKIESTIASLQAVLDTYEGDPEPVKEALCRLERIAAEVVRVEEAVSGQVATAGK